MDPPKELPFKVRPFEKDVQERITRDFGKGFPKGFVKANHWDVVLMGHVTEEMLQQCYNKPVQDGDIWVVSLPKCGTTWTQEMVWLLANDLKYETATRPLDDRYNFLEFSLLHDPDHVRNMFAEAKKLAPEMTLDPAQRLAVSTQHSRFVKSHLPMSLNPPDLLKKAKVIYVARNPKDMVVSYFNHLKALKLQGFDSDFATLFEHFINGQTLETPFFPHVLEAWHLRRHPNMCFIFYEDMKKDLRSVITKVAKFLGKTLTDEQMEKLVNHLHIDNMRKNPNVNNEFLRDVPGLMDPERSFINKGQTGSWKAHLTPEMVKKMDAWIEENLLGTDLSFVDQLTTEQ
ncbi:luciferin sulfotransferase-like isoform X2 [Amphibalanus amphitrite]|uniref:luciferin sulfotransferase-like isoform X2 n=1 Tax=Amphibalanus amphitrite TaxID=1232801 RepID=UPI001C92B041|nr:luciferin sulfotransferase-like isoform X2 [Amphibalanus amphitrite]